MFFLLNFRWHCFLYSCSLHAETMIIINSQLFCISFDIGNFPNGVIPSGNFLRVFSQVASLNFWEVAAWETAQLGNHATWEIVTLF